MNSGKPLQTHKMGQYLILLDINMPVMDGLEFLRRRDDNPLWLKIPTVILSSSHEKNIKESALKLGA